MTMKRLFFSLFLVLVVMSASAQVNDDPILMTIGQKKITRSEFNYIWNKNNTETSFEKQSLDEYLNLFVNFKLKVAEAESQGLDKKKSFIDELDGYRRQLVVPYLTDTETEEKVAKITYDRMREYVEASHILIRVAPFATPEDTVAAWYKASEVYKLATADPSNFSTLAASYSDDVTKSQGGYIGFVTGIRFFYTFENGIYGTPVGTISHPLRTEYGYHIIKVHSRRPAFGRYQSSHIMKKVKDTDTPEVQKAAQDAIFKVYESLKKGEDFSQLAQRFSDDGKTATEGGDLGMVYCGSLPIEFEEVVFKQKIDTYSEPFKTSYGWHIVKPKAVEPYPSFESMREDINNIVNKDERVEESRNVLVEKLKKEYGSSVNQRALNEIILSYNNLRLKKDSSGVKQLRNSSLRLFTLGKTDFTQKDFLVYLSAKPLLANNITKAFSGFMKDKVIAYEDAILEKKYPEFGHLMQEYRDGILLFEISSNEVWDKTATDEAALHAYFKEHKKNYAWDKPRFKGFLVQCATKEIAEKAKKRIKQVPADSVFVTLDREFNSGNSLNVFVEQGLFEQGDNTTIDKLVFKKTDVLVESNLPEAFVEGRILKNGPEEYSDVMGLVVSDYQNQLEEKWLEALRKKYSVTINEAVLKTVNNN